MPRPPVIRSATAEVLDGDPGSRITLLADPEHTGGSITCNRSELHEGSAGAPPHRHARSSELLHVLGGTLEVLLDEELVLLGAGDALVVPAGLTHAFAPGPGTAADVLCVFTPGTARFDYYRLLDRAHRGQAGWDEVAASGPRFDNRYVESAVWAARPR